MIGLTERFLPRINAMRKAVVEMRGRVDGITMGASARKNQERHLAEKTSESSKVIHIESLKIKE